MYDIKNFMYVYVFAVVTEVSHLKHNLSLREKISIYGYGDFVYQNCKSEIINQKLL